MILSFQVVHQLKATMLLIAPPGGPKGSRRT